MPNIVLEILRNLRRKEAKLYIKFAANIAKEYYNLKHIPITINIRDWVYLKLHYSYNLSKKPNQKLSK